MTNATDATAAIEPDTGAHGRRADAARRMVLPHSRPRPAPDAAAGPLPFADGPGAMRWFTAARVGLEGHFSRLMRDGAVTAAAHFAHTAGALWEIAGYQRLWHDLYRDGFIAATTAGLDDAVRGNLLGYADALWQLDQPAAAAAAYRRTLAYAVAAADWWTTGFAHRGIATLAIDLDDTAGARSHLDGADECFRRCADPRGTAMVLRSRAALRLALGQTAAARDLAAQAVSEFAAIDDPWSLAWGRFEYGRILHATGASAAAIEPLEAAADTFDQYQDGLHRSLAYTLLADAAAQTGNQGDAQRYRTAAACEATAD